MAGRLSEKADDDVLYKRRHFVRACLPALDDNMSKVLLVFPDKLECSETLRRTHPPLAILLAVVSGMKGLP